MVKKVLVGFGIDVDAVAGWIDTQDGTMADPVNVSRGLFGAAVGIKRLLNLLKQHNIKASWFVPAHTVESFPKAIKAIVDEGHEIGLHGYSHEFVSKLSKEQEAAVLKKSISVLTSFTGQRPRGWTAPAWTVSSHTISLLEEAGIQYDHSFMHHDCQLYYTPYSDYNATSTRYNSANAASVPASPEEWMKPMSVPRISPIVTVPANWHLDDWPPCQPGDGGSDGFVDPWVLERMWKDHFEYCYEEYDTFVMPISIHPQVSGKPQLIKMHARFIEWVNGHEGVQWCTFENMVKAFVDDGFAAWDSISELK